MVFSPLREGEAKYVFVRVRVIGGGGGGGGLFSIQKGGQDPMGLTKFKLSLYDTLLK